MNTAKVVIREVQGNSGLQVAQLARESVREPSQPSELHPHGQVLPFNVARRDVLRVEISAANLGYNLRDPSWGVPLILELPIVSEQFGRPSSDSKARLSFSDWCSPLATRLMYEAFTPNRFAMQE
jgi:hypothetical protein